MFIKPLSLHLWAAMALHSLVLVVLLRALWWYYDRKKLALSNVSIVERCLQTIQYYIMLSATYLGNGNAQMPHNKHSVIKIILFSSSMVGMVIWMSYRASLASTLAVRQFRLPFESVAELADNNDYRKSSKFYQLKSI